MQLAFSFDFAQARSVHDEAYAAFAAKFDPNGEYGPEQEALNNCWERAREALLLTPADTPAGVREKLEIIDEVDARLWESWPQYEAVLDQDLLDLRRPAATLRGPFETWRAARLAHELCAADDDGVADALCLSEAEACRVLLGSACASPGDFLLKAYVGVIGQTAGERRDAAASIWDADLASTDGSANIDLALLQSAYHDLDMSDLGACLLAFGRLDFSAEEWLDRALTLKIPISLHVDSQSRPTLSLGLHYRGTCQRTRRERQRLERLLAFDPGRAIAVGEIIVRDWPQLVECDDKAA